jgi:hypothetical protein
VGSRERELSARTVARIESRWPPVMAVLAVLVILIFLPGRYRVVPAWISYTCALAMLATMSAVIVAPGKALFLRIERYAIFAFAIVAAAIIYFTLGRLLSAIIHHTENIQPTTLLASAVALWMVNVVVSALVYWQMDRNGPEGRVSGEGYPDFVFPQEQAPELVPPGWLPTFVDYLSLAITTAVAFSPTDALPFTSRAKLAMIVESLTSLVTVVVIAARAIGILQ